MSIHFGHFGGKGCRGISESEVLAAPIKLGLVVTERGIELGLGLMNGYQSGWST